MVKQKYINNVLYNLFDEIARTQEQCHLIADELRNNGYDASLYPKKSKIRETFYYVYYKNKRKNIPNKQYVNNNGSIYFLHDKIERSKKGAIEKVIELRNNNLRALIRPNGAIKKKKENTTYFVYYKEKISNYIDNIKLTV